MDIKLRFAAPSDAAKLAAIYRPYVENTTVTLEYEVPSEEEFRMRIEEYSAELPYIVCEADGVIAGYAYAHKFKVRFGYRYCAELSIYLDGAYRGMGLGKRMYGALIEMCALLGYTNLYGVVTDPNPASFALHEAMGFRESGREHLAGYKFGKWFDVVIFERLLSEPRDAVSSHTSCPMLIGDLTDAETILKKYEHH